MHRQPFANDYLVTQRYGEKFTGPFHTGIDYACPEETDILASESGIVMQCGWDFTGYGNLVIIEHSDGKATLYAHLNSWKCFVGAKVKKGEVIGKSGNTGASTGPHLHFEMRNNWKDYKSHIDPMPWMETDISLAYTPTDTSRYEKITPGLGVIFCPMANIRAVGTYRLLGTLNAGTDIEMTDETDIYNGITYRKCKMTVMIAENDNYGNQILSNGGLH